MSHVLSFYLLWHGLWREECPHSPSISTTSCMTSRPEVVQSTQTHKVFHMFSVLAKVAISLLFSSLFLFVTTFQFRDKTVRCSTPGCTNLVLTITQLKDVESCRGSHSFGMASREKSGSRLSVVLLAGLPEEGHIFFFYPKSAYGLCSAHFEDFSFERNLAAELLAAGLI